LDRPGSGQLYFRRFFGRGTGSWWKLARVLAKVSER
jgi:hypothetical protein